MTDTEIGRLDTPGDAAAVPRKAGGNRLVLCAAFVALMLGLGVELDRAAAAERRPLDARVVWSGADHAVIASEDSLEVAQGDSIAFISRGRTIATGAIVDIIESTAAVVVLSAAFGDSLAHRVTDQLELVRRPIPAPPVLRVGYPSGSRSNLIIDCGRTTLTLPGPVHAYRVEEKTDHRFRLVRDPDAIVRPSWPDTLIVRLFDESGDEEIAMERGDLDVAVFWPGELSTHARALPTMIEGVGTMRRGVIGAIWLGPERAPDDSVAITVPDLHALGQLQTDLLGYDLAPYGVRGFEHPDSSWRPSAEHSTARFEVDHALPGWRALEVYLDRHSGPRAARERPGRIWVFYVDAPWYDPPAVANAIARRFGSGPVPPACRARAESLAAEFRGPGNRFADARALQRVLGERLHARMLFVPACALLCRPALREYLRFGPGLESLGNLLDCSPAPPR